ncbi:MAG: PAS domain S-box protein [Rhodopseudomonas palustris]|uniref:histidine kinase n=1 Tax=Rhodopseudomonas palustris TaxID=1076 RepID=A0A933VTA7_RHOPL|nr:PAS domain S-box protein [Rhodopseudomonas palustris]
MNDQIAKDPLARDMYRLAVEACPNGLVMIGGAGEIVMVNSEVEQQFGYRRDELIGMPVEMLLPERLRGRRGSHRNGYLKAAGHDREEDTSSMTSHDLFGLRKNGSEFPVEVGFNSVDCNDQVLVLSVIIDVSQRKQIERLKDEFISTVSHELRTPLTSIAGSLGLLTGHWGGKLPEAAERLLTIAHNNSQRLVRLINDILDIEKLDAGRVAFNFVRIEARLVIAQAIEESGGFADRFGVKVEFDPASVDTEVNVDPDRLSQVVTNLLSNAIKFSAAGGVVNVGLACDGELIRITVRDHGGGIPENFKSHVFDKFSQADGTLSKEKGGTGLGLSIVKQLTERLGGKVSFADAVGGGTVFSIELPKWDGAAPGDLDADAEAGAIRILLCADDRTAADEYRRQFGLVGFSVDFASTAAAATARLDAHPYAAALVDLPFHDGDGIDLIRRARSMSRYRETPIVVIAEDSARQRREIRSSGPNVLEWINKPIDFEVLSPILREAISPQIRERHRVLHLDDDPDVLARVAIELSPMAEVVSVADLESARRCLCSNRIDLAVLDMEIGSESGLDLIPDLHDAAGNPVPVVLFSVHSESTMSVEQVRYRLSKVNGSLSSLAAVVRDRLAMVPLYAAKGEL